MQCIFFVKLNHHSGHPFLYHSIGSIFISGFLSKYKSKLCIMCIMHAIHTLTKRFVKKTSHVTVSYLDCYSKLFIYSTDSEQSLRIKKVLWLKVDEAWFVLEFNCMFIRKEFQDVLVHDLCGKNGKQDEILMSMFALTISGSEGMQLRAEIIQQSVSCLY